VAISVGARIQELRRERGWSAQRLVDEIASSGSGSLTRGTIAKIESGVRKAVTAEELVELARAFAVSVDDLVGAPAQPSVASRSSVRPTVQNRQTVRDLTDIIRTLNRAALDRPIVDTIGSDDGLRAPTLAQGYVLPRFKVSRVAASTSNSISDETWWATLPSRDDLDLFLAEFLTSRQATSEPLLIVGNPGSGKSLMLRVLAARLPHDEYLPIIVRLREVDATSPILRQIEAAIERMTAEVVNWGTLARGIGNQMPIIMLDGLDEISRATGLGLSDYFEQVAEFQRRETELGRPVALMVTSRTVAMARTRILRGVTAIYLDDFDESRAEEWLANWNSVNAEYFASHGLRPLSARVALEHRDFSAQPLLLLLLALFDAQGNELQHRRAEFASNAVYGDLLASFIRREIDKGEQIMSVDESDQLVRRELDYLAVAAIGMFNRGTLRISEDDLAGDLELLVGEDRASAPDSFVRRASNLIDSFFVLHSAAPRPDRGSIARSYEFMHFNFGEYLVAGYIADIMQEMASMGTEVSRRMRSYRLDDDLLRAILSYRPLSSRVSILTFLEGFVSDIDRDARQRILAALTRAFSQADQPRTGGLFDGYQPQRPSVVRRYAVYTANLVILMSTLSDEIRASDLFDIDPTDGWHRQKLLWRSQLTHDDWDHFTRAIEAQSSSDGDDVVLSLNSARPAG